MKENMKPYHLLLMTTVVLLAPHLDKNWAYGFAVGSLFITVVEIFKNK